MDSRMNYFVIRKIYLATALIWLGAGDLFGQYAISLSPANGNTAMFAPPSGNNPDYGTQCRSGMISISITAPQGQTPLVTLAVRFSLNNPQTAYLTHYQLLRTSNRLLSHVDGNPDWNDTANGTTIDPSNPASIFLEFNRDTNDPQIPGQVIGTWSVTAEFTALGQTYTSNASTGTVSFAPLQGSQQGGQQQGGQQQGGQQQGGQQSQQGPNNPGTPQPTHHWPPFWIRKWYHQNNLINGFQTRSWPPTATQFHNNLGSNPFSRIQLRLPKPYWVDTKTHKQKAAPTINVLTIYPRGQTGRANRSTGLGGRVVR